MKPHLVVQGETIKDIDVKLFIHFFMPSADKPSDAEILKVIEAYCQSGKARALLCKYITTLYKCN